MKQYTGTKTIKAKPMTRLEYNNYRGWNLLDNQNGDDEGYLVEYIESPNSNHPNHKFFISWLLADVFDKTYKPSETYLDRLYIERDELQDKIIKLENFINSIKFEDLSLEKRVEIRCQKNCMKLYLDCLQNRIHLDTK